MAKTRPAAIFYNDLSFASFSETAFEQHVAEQAGIIGHDPVTTQFAITSAAIGNRRKPKVEEEYGYQA